MYVRILLWAAVFAVIGGVMGLAALGGDRELQKLGGFIGACTGILFGAIIGATRSILCDLPDAIERARFVRKIKEIEEGPEAYE